LRTDPDLLAQFISLKVSDDQMVMLSFTHLPQVNHRQDEYSAMTAPLHLLHRIACEIRKIVPAGFILGVKLNAADYLDSEVSDQHVADAKRAQEDRALDHVKQIASWRSIDFIEVSGGDYENPGAAIPFSLLSKILNRMNKNSWPHPLHGKLSFQDFHDAL
jgi:2,4-dienoyl-CoA reductase-like NADH-dependent reductase (Old Yellow Enzyme family)